MTAVTATYAPSTFAFSDAAVFGRASNAVLAYLDRTIDEVPAEPKTPGMIETLVARIGDYFARRSTVAELNRLPDALLADMGIARDEIEHIVLR